MASQTPQPTSYKTNVNRAKTKRWVEAKSYSYDGDEWGDADEYDEYGADEEPPPQQKPTGLRQPGQSANQPSPLCSSVRTEDHQAVDTAKHGYGNIGGPPVTQPPPASKSIEFQPQVTPNIVRSNSFDRGDEKRAFSAASHQQSIPAASPRAHEAPVRQEQTLLPPFTQASNQAPQSQQGAYPPPLLQKAPYRAPPDHRDPLQTSRIPSNITDDDHFQSPDLFSTEHRRNLPELGGPPLRIESQLSGDMERRNPDQRHSPSSNYRGVSYSDQPLQPRNSSLGSRTQSMTSNNSSLDFHNRRDFTPSAIPPPLQTRGSPSPREPFDPQSFAQHPPRKSSLSHGVLPNAEGLDQVPQPYPPTALGGDPIASRDQAGNSATPQPLPFPRPSDIYKRIPEEREKELRSPTSSRPSMELGGPTEIESTMIRPHAGPHIFADGQATGSSQTEVPGLASAAETSHNLRTHLHPVAERKSEYGFDGLQVDKQKPEDDPKGTSLVASTPRPFLPDVTRMSGFGDLLLSAGAITGEHSEPASQERTSRLTQDAPSHERTGASLQHHPSLGFRSVVHQAFDQEPETPSSTAGSGIGRSTSGGTSVVSPILSRGASLAKGSGPASIPETRVFIPSANDDESGSGHISSDVMNAPKPIARKPSPSRSPLQDSLESIPTTFKPGHRRNFSTPSSDGSPARTPILETNVMTIKPLEAEIETATPVTPTDPTHQSTVTLQPQIASINDGKSEVSRSTHGQTAQQTPSQSPITLPRLATHRASRIGDTSHGFRDNGAVDSPADPMTRIRAESPSKNRVRDLAGKFEIGNNNRRGSDLSTGLSGGVSPKKDNLPQARPSADRLESFRPHLPGGWDSYTSTIPAATPTVREPSTEGRSEGKTNNNDVLDAPKNIPSAPVTPTAESPTKTSKGPDVPLPKTESAQLSSDPFANAAAAGSALAEALVAAMGITREESPIISDALQLQKEPEHEDPLKQSVITTRNLASSGNTVVHPEASRTFISSTSDDEESGGQPTPPPKEPSKEVAQQPTDEDSGSAKSATAATLQGSLPEETRSVENAVHPYPQSTLPPLSTDLLAHQYESDRLRREIVKNLSPRGTSEPTTAESESPWQDESTLSADPSLGPYRHDSMALPSEYESYWNGSNNGSRSNSAHIKYDSPNDPDQRFHDETIKPPQPLQLSAAQQNRNSDDIILANKPSLQPSLLQKRYSWDVASGESVTQKPTADNAATSQSYVPSPESHDSKKALNDAPIPSAESQDSYKFVDERSGPSNQRSESLSLVNDQFLEGKGRSLQSGIPASNIAQDYSEKISLGRDEGSDREKQLRPVEKGSLPEYLGAPIASDPPPAIKDDHSILHPSPTDRDHVNQTAGAGSQNFPQYSARYIKAAPTQNFDTITTSPPAASSPQAKVATFRDILALQTPAERIRAFNETREQLANLDQGLSHWLAVKTNEMPEHASGASVSDKPPPVAAGQKPSAFKSKLPGIRSSGAQQAQQPYYQQYLNATPQASGSEANIGQPASASNSSQSLPPGGGTSGKLSTQQVQAKGKDFLHSAGVLGGKANVAAKGFFSKGRSKLRGSTGVDKVTNPNPSPDPYSEGPQPHDQPHDQPYNQPQHQPHGEQTTSYTSQPILQQASSVESNSSLPHATSVATTLSPTDTTSDQRSQPWQTDEDSNQQSSKNEPTVSDLSRPPRSSSLLPSNIITSQDTSTNTGANKPVGKAVVGDTPIFLHATPEAELYVSSPQAQRRLSDSSSNQTPTQADFTKPGPNVQTSSFPLTDDKAGSQEQQESGSSKEPEQTLSLGPQQGMENEKRGISVPRSRYSTHILPSMDKNQVEPRGFSETEPRIGSEPRILFQTSIQESLPASASAGRAISDAPMDSAQVTPRQGISNERPPRPFSFMEISDNEANQRPIKTSQREPSVSSSDGRQFYDRPPSPVSPQRSITREVSDLHEQGQYDPHRSSSQPLQDPNISNHPAYRRVSQPRQDPHPSFEHYPGRTTREDANLPRQHTEDYRPEGVERTPISQPEDARLPRQHTIDYRPEGVGPTPISQPEPTASRSRRGSRSSTFFRNLAKSEEPPLPTNGSDQVQFAAKSPNQATAPNEGKRSKRNSVFRTLTGRSGGGDRDPNRGSISEKPRVIPQSKSPPREYTPIIAPLPPSNNPRVESSTSSKVKSKTLQRASTSAVPEKKDGGKKKRFSAIGSLFGRSSYEKSSSIKARPPQPPPQFHQQPPPFRQSQAPQTYTPRQDPSSYNQYSEPAFRGGQAESMSSRYGSQPPPQQQGYARPPPEGGYYAPDRTPSRVYTPDRISANRVASPPPSSPANYPRRGPEAPAYIQDASLRQPGFQSPTSPSRFSSSAATQQRIASPPPQTIGETRFYDHTSPNEPRRSAWIRTPSQLQPTSFPGPRVVGMENPYPPRRDSLNSSATAAAMIQQQQQPPPNPRNMRTAAYERYNNSSAPPTSQSPPRSRVPSSIYAPAPLTQEAINNGPRRSSSPAPPAPPPKDELYPLAHSPRSSLGVGFIQPQQQKASPAVLPKYTSNTAPARTLSTPPPPTSSAAAVPNSSYNSSSSTTTTTVTTTMPYSTTTTVFPLPTNERNQSPPLTPPEQSTNDNSTAAASSLSAAATAARFNQLPPIQTSIPAQNVGERREQQQQQHDGSGVVIAELGAGKVDDDEDEEIVMSSTSYPGQEWTPSRYERWDGD